MKIYFLSTASYEDWDWTNVEKGIGGSETSQIEMSWRLAQRGYEVICYAPVPWKGVKKHKGVTWTHFKNADFTAEGLWIIYRTPGILDSFGERTPKQPRWLMCQDVHYSDSVTKERVEKLDKVLALCGDHVSQLHHNYPWIKGKMWNTSNGVRVDLIREVEKENIVRNPYKLIYASSPDRGLVTLLKIFKKAKQFIPELELHVFYGFNNIDKLTQGEAPWKDALIKIKSEIEKGLVQEGVFWRGRVSQKELYKEWLSAGMWVYPTEFTETSCITSMEAQALGAIPITNPIWALKSNVGFGISIEGNAYSDELVQSRYVADIVRLCKTPEMQTRDSMMRWAREAFNWERFVDQWDCEIRGMPITVGQFNFQHRYAKGRVINVGCDIDSSNWLERGAVNIDVIPKSPILKMDNRYHLLHDARNKFPENLGKFDTIILGDIMEHIKEMDWKKILVNCKNILNKEGQIIITCPDDGNRDRLKQHWGLHGAEEYTDGCSSFHTRYISHEDILKQLKIAGLKETLYQVIDYTLFTGHGIICSKSLSTSAK